MNKKVIAIVLLVALALSSVFAASVKNPFAKYDGVSKKDSLALGINLGTHTGLAVRYGMGSFDVIGDLNYHLGNTSAIGVDAGAMYHVTDVKIKNDFGVTKATFPITVGAMVDLGVLLGDNSGIGLSVLVPVAIEYTFEGAPFTVYLRVAPGLSVIPSLGFDINAGLGCVYTF